MIKRAYFMSAKKAWNDGAGSYSFAHTTATVTSFLPKPLEVYPKMVKELESLLEDKPGNSLEVVSFNRV